MEKTEILEIDGATGEFRKNSWGWFVVEWNGIKWPYEEYHQLASTTPEEAVKSLLDVLEDED